MDQNGMLMYPLKRNAYVEPANTKPSKLCFYWALPHLQSTELFLGQEFKTIFIATFTFLKEFISFFCNKGCAYYKRE